MLNILYKELRLSASPLSYCFIAFGLMFFLPGYPVLCGAFFTCLGIYQSFQNAREANDAVFTALLPVAKRDVVKGKYLFAGFIEICSLCVMACAMLLRMTAFKDALPFRSNALMNANPYALGMAAVIFGLFNLIFIGGFFKTAYKLGKPFIAFAVVNFLVIGLAEASHYIRGLGALNAFGTDELPLQLILLAGGLVLSLALTLLSYRKAYRNFEEIDL